MKKTISLLAVSAISMPALAADMDGWYGSMGGGVYRLDSGAFNDVAPTMKILGGYNLSEFVALEASYTRLFESSDVIDGARVAIDGNVWDFSTRLSYPLKNRFSPFVRLGYSYVDTGARINDSGVITRLSDYDNAFTWAVGSGFSVNRRVSVSGELARTLIQDGDLDFLTVRLNYGFGAQ